MLMKKIFYLYSKSLLSKLALMAILIVGGGNSAWAQKSLPYSYGFENNDLHTEGWTIQNGRTDAGYTTGIIFSSNVSHTGTYHFRFHANTNPPQYLISPLLNSSENGLEISFYYRGYGNSSSASVSFQVGYSSTTNSTENFTWKEEVSFYSSSYAQYQTTVPTGTLYIAIKYNTNAENNYRYLCIDDIVITEDNPNKTPTDFILDSFTENTATFSWTAGNSETAWQLAYSTDENFTPGTDGTTLDITDNPYTLTGLTEGTTYYAAIRANYGDGKYSDWTTDRVSFTPRAEIETTINSGTNTNQYIPIYLNGVTTNTNSQFIIPSTSLTEIVNRQITQIVFYTYSPSSWDGKSSTFEVYLNETSNTAFESVTFSDWGVNVLNSATVTVSSQTMTITLNTPYNYRGGNLKIGFKQTGAGTVNTYASWYGIISGTSNNAISSANATRQTFYPKMTIISVPATTAPVQMGLNGYTTFASSYPLDLSNLPSGLKAYKAAVDAENSRVNFTEINQTVPANTGMLLEGTAGTTYAIPVADSGTAPEGNDFLVNSTGGTFTADEGYTYYGMKKATSAEDPIVFATFAPGSVAIPSNKAYLIVENAPSGASRQLVCAFSDNTTTAIAEIANRQNGQNSYFNLAGQRVDGSRFTVNGAGMKPGLYIINGKKVVIK